MHPRAADLHRLQRTFVPPAGLGLARPRDVRLTSSGLVLAILAIAVVAGSVPVGLLLSVHHARQLAQREAWTVEAVTAEARVTRRWETDDDEPRHMAAYAYVVDGVTYDGEGRLSRDRSRRVSVGDSVQVRYRPSNPSVSRLEGTPPGVLPVWVPWLIPAAMAIFGALILVPLVRQARLLSEGRAAPAIVTEIKKHRSHEGGTHRTIEYVYPLMSGTTATGRATAPRKPPAVNSSISVIYDPDQPTRSRPYPLSLVRPA